MTIEEVYDLYEAKCVECSQLIEQNEMFRNKLKQFDELNKDAFAAICRLNKEISDLQKLEKVKMVELL